MIGDIYGSSAAPSLEMLMRLLKPHDHLCLIYESEDEWAQTIVPFILTGLEHGEKCLYIVDANTAKQIKTILLDAGLDVAAAERKGQFVVIHERDTYTKEGFFDPDLMIKLLISETEKALSEGYPALRATGEMSWALRGYIGSDRLLEYEAKLNRDFFPNYPCLAICQYDRRRFDPEIIKGVILTHTLLIRGKQIYRNFYYMEPEAYLSQQKSEREVQRWLDNLERERHSQEALLRQEEQLRKQNELLLGLIAGGSWGQGDLKRCAAEIAEACAELMQVERVSIWGYNDNYASIRCFALYERSKGRHSEGEELPSGEFPLYVESHKQGESIAVEDVFADPRTSHLPAADYFGRHNIKSLLDAPIWLYDRLGGLLSFEQVGEKRAWTKADERLSATMAVLVSLCIVSSKRKRAVEALEKLNRELEQRVQERTLQLELSNKELEAFAYSVSHDLRSPLRALDGFSRILLEEYANILDAEGKRLLDIIRENAQHMDQLITDLLILSRVVRAEMQLSSVDMTALAHAVYRKIAPSDLQERFVFSVESLPAAPGDAVMLRQVWHNLLANAVKFTLPRPAGRIAVGGYTVDNMHVYYVEDNGVGFDPQYSHKLFGVFQRLHGREEFEGTGIGLAIVQRIVQRHGGQVWARGKVNEGAAFYFSIPATVKGDGNERI